MRLLSAAYDSPSLDQIKEYSLSSNLDEPNFDWTSRAFQEPPDEQTCTMLI